MFKSGSKKNEAAATFLESMGKNDDKNMIDLALNGMGITRNKIEDDTNKEKKFDETASKAIARLRSVSDYMTEKKYVKINPETLPLIEKYIADEKADITDLDKLATRGDVFYKETTVADKT
jgi:16S rRNA G527 N7-methylase RsmG